MVLVIVLLIINLSIRTYCSAQTVHPTVFRAVACSALCTAAASRNSDEHTHDVIEVRFKLKRVTILYIHMCVRCIYRCIYTGVLFKVLLFLIVSLRNHLFIRINCSAQSVHPTMFRAVACPARCTAAAGRNSD